MSASGYPQVYYTSEYAHDGGYSLRMLDRCVYAMPELGEGVELSGLRMRLYVRQPYSFYQLEVGVWDEESGEWSFRPDLLCLAQGPRYVGQGIAAEMHDGRLHIACPDTGMNNTHGVTDDQLMVAIYRPAVPALHLLNGPLREACSECIVELPETEGEEDMMLVYVWFQATKYHRSGGGKITVRPGQASKSVFLGAFSK